MKKVVCALCALLLTVSVFVLCASFFDTPVSGAYGISDAKVQKLEEQLAGLKKEISGLQSKINSAKKDKNAKLQEKNDLDRQIKLTQDKIALTGELIETLNLGIENKEGEIAVKESEYAKKLDNFKQRLRINYEEGEIGYVDMMLGAASLGEFFEKLDRVGCMIEYDNEVMTTISSDKAALENDKKDLESALEKQENLLAELKADEEKLEQDAETAAGYIQALLKDETLYAAQLAEKEKERDAINKELDDYVKQLKAQNTKYIGGEFMWPVPTEYTYVSSECAWRTSPISGRKEFHNGMDIPVKFGTDIYASNAGTVVKSQWHSSYGYYVMIDHGGGYATLYAHNSTLLVSVGDEVERGQVIAKAGSTGDSTGNHCHFSMYENGVIINPRKYFPA